MMSRPLPYVLPLLLLAAAVLAVVGLWPLLSRQLSSYVEQRVARAFGPAETSSSGLELEGGALVIRDLRVEQRERGLRLHVDRLSMSPSLKALLIQRRPMLDRIEAEGVVVEIDERWFRRKPATDVDSRGAGSQEGRLASLSSLLADNGTVAVNPITLVALSHRLGKELGRLDATMMGAREHGEASFRGSGRTAGEGRVQWEARVSASGAGAGSVRMEGVSLKPLLDLFPEVSWHRPESASFDGAFDFAPSPSKGIALAGWMDVRGLGVQWSPIAEKPIRTDVSVRLRGVWDGKTLEVERGRFRSGEAEIEWNGRLSSSGERVFADLSIQLPKTPCQQVLSAVPKAALAEFSGFELEGTMEGNLRLRLDSEKPDETEFSVGVSDRCRFRGVPEAASVSTLRRVFWHRVPEGVVFETGPGSKNWVPLSKTSPFLVHAVLAHEDATFFQHHGFAPDAFETALERNLEERRFASGASTISMQLARNLFLARDKTLARKLKEILLTWWLEKSLTKREILELYLNLIEFGDGVYGIGPAARHYFGRSPADLSPAESAFLAVVLPSPRSYDRQYQRGRLSSATVSQMEQLLRHMERRNRIDPVALEYGLAELDGFGFPNARRRPPGGRSSMGFAAPLPIE